jgi:pimeloyl-ACP methyl ester carboxylesterase
MRRLRRIGSLAAAAAVALTLLAPASAGTAAQTTATRSATPSYSLKPGPCPLPTLKRWECATLDVPIDWFDTANPDRAKIAVAVHRATGERRGTLTLNPGGPGSSAILVADVIMKVLPATVKRHFDIVLWDPRGIGLSTPVPTECTTNPTALPVIPATGPVDWSRVTDEYLTAQQVANQQCYEANLDLAPYLGTQFVVRDLDALRQALDVPRWTYWGMSYGTRIGLLYAQLYPSRIRAMLLDGSVQPNSSLADLATSRGATLEAALALLGTSMGRVRSARMYQVIDALNLKTYVNADGRTVTRESFLTEMVSAAGSQELIPYAVDLVDSSYTALFGSPRSVTQRVDEPDQGFQYARRFVNCGDYRDRPSVAQAAAIAETSAESGTVRAGQLALVWLGWCAGLPTAEHPVSRVRSPINLTNPPVVLNALGDPATPWVWARQMANYFRGASLITYDGVGHVLYGHTPSRCVNGAVTAYLMRLKSPGNLTCPYVPS